MSAKKELPSTLAGRRKLIKLAELLESDANNKKGIKFDLTTWGEAASEEGVGVSCGTTACAMGLAALSRAFRGLKHDVLVCDDGSVNLEVRCGERTGCGAAEELFQITGTEAEWLFTPEGYPDNQRLTGKTGELFVARRIRKFVAGEEAPPAFRLIEWSF